MGEFVNANITEEEIIRANQGHSIELGRLID